MRHQFTLLLREMKFLPHDDPKAREVNKYSSMSKFPIHSTFLFGVVPEVTANTLKKC